MQLHGNEWNDIICNIVKFMASSEARGHDMMIRLHNTSLNPQNLRNIIKKLQKLVLLKLLSNLSVKTTVFCYFLDIPQISQVLVSSRY